MAKKGEPGRAIWLGVWASFFGGLVGGAFLIFSTGPLDGFAQWYARGQVATRRVVAFGSTSLDTKQASADAYERDIVARGRPGHGRVAAAAQVFERHIDALGLQQGAHLIGGVGTLEVEPGAGWKVDRRIGCLALDAGEVEAARNGDDQKGRGHEGRKIKVDADQQAPELEGVHRGILLENLALQRLRAHDPERGSGRNPSPQRRSAAGSRRDGRCSGVHSLGSNHRIYALEQEIHQEGRPPRV